MTGEDYFTFGLVFFVILNVIGFLVYKLRSSKPDDGVITPWFDKLDDEIKKGKK